MFHGKKVIIFDLDGTLIDSVGIWNKVDQALISKLTHLNVDEKKVQKDRDEVLRFFAQEKDAYMGYCAFLRQQYAVDISAEAIKALRYEIAKRYMCDVMDFKEEADTCLKELKAKGFKLVLASTTSQANIHLYKTQNQKMLKKLDFDTTFCLMLGRESVEKIKPHPQIHHHIMQTLGVSAQECLVVEDSLVGVEAAHNAGIECIVMYDHFSKDDAIILKQSSIGYFDHFKQLRARIAEALDERV